MAFNCFRDVRYRLVDNDCNCDLLGARNQDGGRLKQRFETSKLRFLGLATDAPEYCELASLKTGQLQ